MPALTGVPRADAPWDPGVPDALREAEVRAEEEAALDDLPADLG
ncbi:hypothetical protein [Streptomyces sp. NPDC057509]